MILQNLPDGTQNPAWIAEKRGQLGASRFGDILKAGKKGEPSLTRRALARELAAERYVGHSFSHANPEWPDIKRGLEHEALALTEYEIERGIILGPAAWVPHPTIEHSGATPDAFVGHEGLAQVKCPRLGNYLAIVFENEIPKEHLPQLNWEMICAQRRWTDFVAFCAEMPEGKRLWVRRHWLTDEIKEQYETEARSFLAEVERYFEALTSTEFVEAI